MNKVYRTVFNEKTNTWVAVAETAKAHGKSGRSGGVVAAVADGMLLNKKMLAVSAAVAAAMAAQPAMADNARIENGSASWTIAISPSDSTAANGGAKATGPTSIAAGWNATATGDRSIAVGYDASTETDPISATDKRVLLVTNPSDKTMYNIAIGSKSKSGGLQTIAIGPESYAARTQSIAFGFKSEATGDQAVALGANTSAKGDSSVAIGGDDLDSVASTVYRQTSSTANNDAYNDTPLAQQYRALTGQNLVNFTPGNRYISTTTGQAGVAVGVSSKAGDLATAIGTKSHATGNHSVAFGVGATADKDNAVALGAGSTTATNATDVPSATIGAITYGGGTSPFAGSGKVLPGDQVSVGSAGYERQIKHVAPGAIDKDSTDAINGSQLFYVAKGLQDQITAAGGNGIHFYHVNGANTDSNYNNDGATGVKAMAAGINAKAAGASSVAIGNAEVAAKSVVGQSNSEGAVAIGDSAYAAGRQAVTLGASRAEEEQAVAIGSNARSSGKASMAIGADAVASPENSISIGSGANTAGNNSVAIGANSSTVVAAAGSVALGHASQATRAAINATQVQANAAPTVANNQVYALASASNADQNNIKATVRGELGAVSVGTQNATRQIINVAAGTEDADAVNVAQLKAVANFATQAVATTPLKVGDGNNGNPAGKVITPTGADANKLATAGDIANAINNSGFNIDAGGNVVGSHTATTAKPGSTLTLKAGDGLTVEQELDGQGNQSYTYALNAQTVVQNAQTPVVYTKADGTKVYKRPDGKFYDAPTGGNEVAAGDVIASMQDAAGNTTDPTTLANVKSNLADAAAATTNPANNDRAALTANNKGNNAATVKDVLNAGFTVQGNGADKDFVTHGDTINFVNGQGTVANVSTTNGVTEVKFDTPMTYVDNAGAPTDTPSNKVNLVGGTAGSPVTLGNVADGNIAAGSKEAINGGQLHATNQNVAKGINFGGTTGSNNYQLGDTIRVKGDSNITSTTENDGVQLGLNPNLNVTSVTTTDAAGNQTVTNGGGVTITPPAGGGNPVSLTTGGLNNGGNKITNVAPGEISATSTDAVNGSQLYNAINNSVGNVAGAVENLQNRMGKLQDDSEAGTASALAAAGLPQAYLPGKSMIAVSGSTYRGQQGYAVGMSAISDSGNWIVKGTATGNSRGHFGATIGAGYQW